MIFLLTKMNSIKYIIKLKIIKKVNQLENSVKFYRKKINSNSNNNTIELKNLNKNKIITEKKN